MPSDFKDALNRTNDAIRRRAFKEAEVPFRTLLTHEPNHADALQLLARLLRSLEKDDEALPLLERLAGLRPTTDVFLSLYSCQAELRRFDEAEESLTRILKDRAEPSLQLSLAKIKRINGRDTEAKALIAATYRMFPEHIPVALARASDVFESDPPAALELVTAVLSRPRTAAAEKSALLRLLTEFRATLALRSSVTFGDAAASWNELMCWPDQEGLAMFENAQADLGPKAALNRALVALSRQEWPRADVFFQNARDPAVPDIVDVVSCDDDFYRMLETVADADIFAGFPAVDVLQAPQGGDGATMFLACDPTYFWRFTLPLMKQFSHSATAARLHVHLLDGDTAEWGRCLEAAGALPNIALSLTAEAAGLSARRRIAAIYYHAARFVRFYQHVKTYGGGAYLLDVDATLRGDSSDLVRGLSQYDVAICGRTHVLEPWKKIPGCCVGISPTAKGLEFARLVAAYIGHWRARGIHRWGIDQAALFGVYAYMLRTQRSPRTLFLPPTMISLNETTAGVLDFVSGHKKFVPKTT